MPRWIKASLVRHVVPMAGALWAAVGGQLAVADEVWDGKSLPITIEVRQDVPIGRQYCSRLQRATLCSAAEATIRNGQRFTMIEMLREGECRIELQGKPYHLGSCPWMPGFRDNQSDIFVVVEFRNRPQS
jgi:hypothetical protein